MPDKTGPFLELLSRREALQGALALAGLAALRPLPSLGAQAAAGRHFAAPEMQLLAEVVDLMLPATDTPGALAARVDVFIDALMADWASAGTRAQMNSLLASIRQAFAGAADTDHRLVLEQLDAAAFSPGSGAEGAAWRRFKQLVFRGYYLSEIGATRELQFDPLPGRFEGCLPLAEVGRSWAAE